MTKEGQMTEKLLVGKAAPGFKLPIDGGGELELAALKGRKVVLYFYPKDNTEGCTKEAIDFNRLKPDFVKAGADIIGISPDNIASHARFRKKHDLAFPLVADEEKSALEAYGVWVEKSMYGRKYMGVERTTVLIDAKGLIARVWTKVKVPGHAEEVLAAAQAI
jgi:thioredoxin-dependent peroxiredoxin